jgi:hypothetical protein
MVSAVVNVKAQLVDPVQPVQLVKVLFGPGVSVSVICVLGAKVKLQPVAEPLEQSIPGGVLVTIPVPVPARETVNAAEGALKVAVTLVPVVTVTLQAAAPVHEPDQLAKVSPVAGVSLSVTCVLGAKLAVHVEGVAAEQLIPAGVLVTVPAPVPAKATVSPSPTLKAAETLAAALMVKLHVVPEQLPLQPAKK